MSPTRYAPRFGFPPYAFLPGRDPHPVGDPRGHSFGREEPPAAYLPAERWRENEPYLFGVDLYNHGYLWEAHEAWESIWHAAKRDTLQASHVQGLIQCAAACLKIPMGQPGGLARLAELGTEKLERVASTSGGSYMGLDLRPWIRDLRAFAAAGPTTIDGRPPLVLEW